MKNKNFFDGLNEWIRDIESSVVNVVSAIAPWLSPLAPAYMTYNHASGALGFPEWVALPIAIMVEILGFSTVSTGLAFWFYNRRNRAEAKRAPMGIVIFAFAFYLTLIITANVLLDALRGSEAALIAVRAMLTLQTIPAALIVAVRTQHRDLLGELEREKQANKANGSANVRQESERENERARTFAGLGEADREFLRTAPTAQAAAVFGVSERAVQKWKKKLELEEVQK